MPRGVYKRKRETKPTPGKEQPANGKELTIANITPRQSIEAFKGYTQVWQGATICVVASATVCLIVGTFSKDKIDHDTTILKLKAEVAETGIREAQVYKYVGLARALVGHIMTKQPKLVQPILKASDPTTAVELIVSWLEKVHVKTLDSLGVMVGKYQRTDQPEPEPEKAPTTEPPETGTIEATTPTKASGYAILARLQKEPEILTGFSAEQLVNNYIKAGHDPSELLDAVIPYINSVRICKKVMTRLERKLDALKTHKEVA